MTLLNKQQIYQKIYDKINEVATKDKTAPYIIAPQFGVSQGTYYEIERFLNANGNEKRLFSNPKLKEVAAKLNIEIQETFYLIK